MVPVHPACHVLTCVLHMQPAGSLVAKAKSLDQARAVLTFLDAASEKTLRATVALTAARGRGKSAALGLGIAGALGLGYSNIFVTAPSPENLRTLFDFIFKAGPSPLLYHAGSLWRNYCAWGLNLQIPYVLAGRWNGMHGDVLCGPEKCARSDCDILCDGRGWMRWVTKSTLTMTWWSRPTPLFRRPLSASTCSGTTARCAHLPVV